MRIKSKFKQTIERIEEKLIMNLKKTYILFCLLFSISPFLSSQDFKKVDSLVYTYPNSFSSPSRLAKRISKDFKTELDRVRAIYIWIANNIVYDPKESGELGYEFGSNEFLKKEKKHNEKLSKRVISKGQAVCAGYSTLFAELSKELNIKSKVVSGSSKTKVSDIGKRFYSDHAWNVVEVDKKLYLVDVTWGAGSYDGRFIKELNSFYFMTPPELFIKNHYPDYFEYALLDKKIDKEVFLNAPLIHSHEYELLSPRYGIIKKSEGKVDFKFSCKPGLYVVMCDLDDNEFYSQDIVTTEDVLEFELDLSDAKKAKKLSVYLDYQQVVEFKLN
ncbi:transglutaminase [Muricauda sp. CAU 1633]|uniref:transglutaminase domain-containing protein n=1 Tax=Allomuricauda sp. CAU 1633 TaxID=2816036 RepID=UPI001A906873|nr:transglutaminase domain-containing protein [Muricauda sp. CAU 1633]MBO0321640.1 transglutaminase [Muricauda sp. CAU 1633]